jgi:hypothetical protein
MMLRRARWVLAAVVLAAPDLSAQAVYAGAGAGPTFVPGEYPDGRNWFGMLGYQSPRGLGFRLSGSETVHRLWLSGDVTYRFGAVRHTVRPYAFGGAGFVIDVSEHDPLLTAGAGLRIRLTSVLSAFAELRAHAGLGLAGREPDTILPFSIGTAIGH